MNSHFIELRDRLIYCLLFFTNIFIVLFYYSDIVYDLFSIPIKHQLPKNSGLIATQITSTFLVPLKLSINTSLILCAPYIILQIWAFISPGLYKNEKTSVLPFIIISIILFFLGISFAFYIICPIALNFFMTCSPSNVTIMISINNYMDFMFTIILACGLSFQIPIIINLIIKMDIISKNSLKEKRSYIFIFAFILGMLLTPPDVISQITLAIPIWLLFELGLFFSK
ncbi:MAG TPA: twin-arginine translocase subunit TatC [Candidatus Azoamicus sp. MARI]